MNILMIYLNNPFNTSGAVTLDLFNEFKAKGHTVKLLVNKYSADYPEGIISMESVYSFYKKKVINKINRVFGHQTKNSTDKKYHFLEIDETISYYKTSSLLKKSGIKPDAIIILYAKNFINSKNIYELNQMSKAPVYWMMYDTSPITGGCHYSWNCLGYQNSCGKCPGLFSDDPHDHTYKNLLYKKQYLDKTDITLVLASEWQHRQASLSTLFKHRPIHKILIAINPDLFKPIPKETSYKKFGIPAGKKVIFFGAYYLDHERKGMHYLLEALKILNELLNENPALKNNILLLIAGQEVDKIKDQLPFEYLSLGMLNNTDGIASAYQAADIFVCPSIEDAGPSMVNQSIMCGTPVVSFAQGVSLDIVITGQTGYCAEEKNSHDLAKGMLSILNLSEEELLQMKDQCRRMALDLFQPKASTEKWLNMISNRQKKI